MPLQGRVLGGGADELPPEPEERGGGPQPRHAGVHRDGQNPAGGQEPSSRGGEIRDFIRSLQIFYWSLVSEGNGISAASVVLLQ